MLIMHYFTFNQKLAMLLSDIQCYTLQTFAGVQE